MGLRLTSWAQGLRLRAGVEGARLALDVGQLAPFSRATVVLAHMDDEINAAGLLCRLREARADVDLVVLTDGAANPWTDEKVLAGRTHFEGRRDELLASVEVLGLSGVELPRFPDSRLEAHLEAATDFLTAHLQRRAPQLLITFEPSGLNGHRDHVAAHVATRRALLRSAPGAALAMITPPPPFSYALGSGFRNQRPITIATLTLSDAEREKKARLVERYASQARTLKLLLGGLPPRRFFRLFPTEWYLWLGAHDAAAWAEMSDPLDRRHSTR
jgi:LmbE family N-acetylglucosaminyl deacetylase